MITEFLTRIRFLIFRKKISDFEHELQFHLELSIAQKIAEGLSTSEARRQALIEFGGLERTREQCDQQRPGWWLSTVLQDARYAMRGFGRNPLFTGSVVETLALGIGATTAVFSVVDRILLGSCPTQTPAESSPSASCTHWNTRSSSWGGFISSGRTIKNPSSHSQAKARARIPATWLRTTQRSSTASASKRASSHSLESRRSWDGTFCLRRIAPTVRL